MYRYDRYVNKVLQVGDYLAEGNTLNQAAEEFKIARRTVSDYVKVIRSEYPRLYAKIKLVRYMKKYTSKGN